MKQHIAAGVKHPDNMNRKEKLAMIKAISQEQSALQAQRWWINHGTRISHKAFMAAAVGPRTNTGANQHGNT